jgi:hypothetical protein
MAAPPCREPHRALLQHGHDGELRQGGRRNAAFMRKLVKLKPAGD